MGGRIIRLAAVRRLERLRRARVVRAIALGAIEDVGGSNAVLAAGYKARLEILEIDERRLWAEVEAELGQLVGFTWWWGEKQDTLPAPAEVSRLR